MPQKTFVEYLEQFKDEGHTLMGIVARRVLHLVNEEGREIVTLPDLLIWAGPDVYPFVLLEGEIIKEDHLRYVWYQYRKSVEPTL